MDTFHIVMEQTGLFVIYMIAGMILVKTKVLSREMMEAIGRYVVKMALPVLAFSNIVNGVKKEVLFQSWQILAVGACYYIITFVIGYLLAKAFRLTDSQSGSYRTMMMLGNVGFMGMPIVCSIFPVNGIIYVSVFMMMDQLMLWTVGVRLTSSENGGKISLKKMVNPAMLGILLAILLVLTGQSLPGILNMGLQKIGSTASPMALIYLGGIFAESHIKKYVKEISLYGIVMVKMILMPMLIFAILNLFQVNYEMKLALPLLVGVPTMTVIVAMANESGADGEYALGGVLLSTLGGIITLPMVCWLLVRLTEWF